MKVAYAYEFDAADPTVQSGRPAAILGELIRHGLDVTPVFPLKQNMRWLYAPKVLHYRRLGKVYRADREPAYLRSIARQVERRLPKLRPDVIFTPGSLLATKMRTSIPIVFCADATFVNVLDFYDSFSNCAAEFVTQGHALEREALRRCSAAVYPSEWAARSAINFYGADPERVHVVPFGANVKAPETAAVRRWIDARLLDPLRILFVGREWERKGADLVLETCRLLRAGSREVRLDLVGIDRPPVALPAWTTNHGLLDKRDPAQKRRLEGLFQDSHFFFVPSQAENYGMAFCEAAAFGLPSLTTTAGGIPTIVRHGVTGYTLPATAPAAEWAAVLSNAAANPATYHAMAHASHQDFCARLSWSAFGVRLQCILASVLGQTPGRVAHP